MILEHDDLIARNEDGDLIIGKSGDYWNDATTMIIPSCSSLVPVILEDHPDQFVELNEHGMFP